MAAVAISVDPFTTKGRDGNATPSTAAAVKGPVRLVQYSAKASLANVALFVSSVGFVKVALWYGYQQYTLPWLFRIAKSDSVS